MANKMLIDATHPEETRVVVLRGNRVEEFDFETAQRKQLRGNIYLAKVTRVEPSLQAAFVDYGGNRHGFLAFSEIHPDYYQIPVADRQALLAEDERAARDEEAEEEQQQRGGRRRGRGGRGREARRHGPRDEAVQSEPLPAEAMTADEAAEIPAGDPGAAVADEPMRADADLPPEAFPADETAVPPVAAAETAPEPSAAPLGESANPPVPAEIAAPAPADTPAVHAEAHTPAALPAAEPTPDHPGGEPSEVLPEPMAEPVAATADDLVAPAETGATGGEHDRGGNGHDEEEEHVESVGGADAMEEVMERAPRYRRQYKIQEVIKRRQVMLVQVVKEERGTKGAALTTYLSLAGRYCVLMPNTARGGGISRKITSVEDRRKLREIADELQVPEGMGVILRTAGAARTKQEVKRDFEYLLRMWEQVRDLTLKSTAPTLVYEEGSLAKRSIRDLYSKDIEEIIVAGEQGYREAKDFMRMLMPSHAKNVKLYRDTQPVFTRYGIESQLDAMFSPTVQLRSGGYIVLNQTEALVSIDVNSGRSTREHHIEDTALKTNVEAAEEVARQLRLRDLAGLIVIDFIDMDEKRNNRTVERRLKDALRNDRARIQVGRISHFGLLEMSRQRIRSSVLESSTEKCAHCGGTGHMRSVSSVALQLLRAMEETLIKGATHNQIVRTRPEIALYVLNHKRAHLSALEQRFRVSLTVNSDPQIGGTTAFAIDRGEQVMSLDQAKALAAEYDATAPQLYVEDEPEIVEGEIEEAAEDARSPEEREGRDAEEIAALPHDPDASEAPHPMQHNGGHEDGERAPGEGRGRRRRRRRGRGGRGGEGRAGEGREHAPFEREPMPGEPGQFMHDPAAPQAGAPYDPAMPPQPQGEPFDPAFAGEMAPQGEPRFGGEPRHHDDPNGNGERRRRRGRRGGRRNRRDREGGNFGGQGYDQPREAHARGGNFGDPSGPGEAGEPYAERPQVADMPEPGPAPRPEATDALAQPVAAPPPPAPAAPEAPPAAAPPRRRSTVREPAPIFGGASAPLATPTPEPPPPAEPAPAPVVTSSAADEAADKPRRTGWWAKRLLGGDKS
jgi:ribonuclease E